MGDVGSISVVYADRAVDPDAKIFGRGDPVIRVSEVSADRLSESLANLSRSMEAVFEKVRTSSGPYELDSFEVFAELSGSGEVRLVGSMSMSVTGGLRLTFKRRDGAGPT